MCNRCSGKFLGGLGQRRDGGWETRLKVRKSRRSWQRRRQSGMLKVAGGCELSRARDGCMCMMTHDRTCTYSMSCQEGVDERQTNDRRTTDGRQTAEMRKRKGAASYLSHIRITATLQRQLPCPEQDNIDIIYFFGRVEL